MTRAPIRPSRSRPMFSRWGSVRLPLPPPRRHPRRRRRRSASRASPSQAVERPELRRLARRGFGVGGRRRPARHGVRDRPELGHRALPLGDAGRRRTLGRVPGRHRDRHRGRRGRPAGHGHRRLRGDRRRAVHQHGRRRRLRRHRARHDRRGVGRGSSTTSAQAIAPPAGYTYQLTGYGPITLDSAEQSEKDLQRAEIVSLPIAALILDPRLRLARRGGHAAARRRPRDPEQPGARSTSSPSRSR